MSTTYEMLPSLLGSGHASESCRQWTGMEGCIICGCFM